MIQRKELGLGTHAWGEASVLKVGLNLIYKGYSVFKPLVDDRGVDLAIVDGNKVARIQVKSSSLITRTRKEGSVMTYYDFSLASVRANISGPAIVRLRTFSDEVDFVVLHGVDEDKLWIVPAHLLDGKKNVTIYSTSRSRSDIDWAVIRERRANGETLKAIGDSVGISASAILERLRGTTKDAGGKIVNQLRACENAWHLIDEFFEASSASDSLSPRDNEGQ